jgi:hypothetical protein
MDRGGMVQVQRRRKREDKCLGIPSANSGSVQFFSCSTFVFSSVVVVVAEVGGEIAEGMGCYACTGAGSEDADTRST